MIRYLLLHICIFFTTTIAAGSGSYERVLELKAVDSIKWYESIVEMSSSPHDSSSPWFYRLVQTKEESYSRLYLEKMKFGSEGDPHLYGTFRIEFRKAIVKLTPKGQPIKVTNLFWETSTSAVIFANNYKFRISYSADIWTLRRVE